MPHFDLLANLATPVRDDGMLIKDANGEVIATVAGHNTFRAAALAALINLGIPGAQAHNEKYAASERAIAGIFTARLAREAGEREAAEYQSNPIIGTVGGAEHFLRRHREATEYHPCYMGHSECSTEKGGPCLDETLTRFPELNDG